MLIPFLSCMHTQSKANTYIPRCLKQIMDPQYCLNRYWHGKKSKQQNRKRKAKTRLNRLLHSRVCSQLGTLWKKKRVERKSKITYSPLLYLWKSLTSCAVKCPQTSMQYKSGMYRINLSFTKVSKISGYSSSLEFKLGPDCSTGAGRWQG